jgi:glycosyltransferase involved in cell wall biosynthesis
VPLVSVVISTYNRGALLHDAIASVLRQRLSRPIAMELVVVDNNSTDETRSVVKRLADADARVRYVFEGQQGSSYGRNTGIREARGRLIAFTDDDVRAEPDWIEAILRAFDEHPNAAVVGGRVLPLWPSPPPAWLTREHWMPLALVDYGDAPVVISPENSLCLVGANMAFRRDVFELVGAFRPQFQLGQHGIIGSVEDHELQLRVLRGGRALVYDPRIVVHAEVQPNRLDRAYHRRWHKGHGHFYALLRLEDMEHTRFGTLLGVPAHLYKQALKDVAVWVKGKTLGDPRAFAHELRLRFFSGFLRTRAREYFSKPGRERREELRRLLRLPVGSREPLAGRAHSGVGQRQ